MLRGSKSTCQPGLAGCGIRQLDSCPARLAPGKSSPAPGLPPCQAAGSARAAAAGPGRSSGGGSCGGALPVQYGTKETTQPCPLYLQIISSVAHRPCNLQGAWLCRAAWVAFGRGAGRAAGCVQAGVRRGVGTVTHGRCDQITVRWCCWRAGRCRLGQDGRSRRRQRSRRSRWRSRTPSRPRSFSTTWRPSKSRPPPCFLYHRPAASPPPPPSPPCPSPPRSRSLPLRASLRPCRTVPRAHLALLGSARLGAVLGELLGPRCFAQHTPASMHLVPPCSLRDASIAPLRGAPRLQKLLRSGPCTPSGDGCRAVGLRARTLALCVFSWQCCSLGARTVVADDSGEAYTRWQ